MNDININTNTGASISPALTSTFFRGRASSLRSARETGGVGRLGVLTGRCQWSGKNQVGEYRLRSGGDAYTAVWIEAPPMSFLPAHYFPLSEPVFRYPRYGTERIFLVPAESQNLLNAECAQMLPAARPLYRPRLATIRGLGLRPMPTPGPDSFLSPSSTTMSKAESATPSYSRRLGLGLDIAAMHAITTQTRRQALRYKIQEDDAIHDTHEIRYLTPYADQ
ncbi:hypothetical protein B0H13DRAFT_2098587 [Mycena leptocephala]|nr:hypothetical protein B0H13DRAFT_2098587 [Mycena leptocephala]